MSYKQSQLKLDRARIDLKVSGSVGSEFSFSSEKRSQEWKDTKPVVECIKYKDQCLKQLNRGVKINRNVQNSFPQNFFFGSKTQRLKKDQVESRKSYNQNKIQQIDSQEKDKKVDQHIYSSIDLKVSMPSVDSFKNRLQNNPRTNLFKETSTRINLFKVKRFHSCGMSMQKKGLSMQKKGLSIQKKGLSIQKKGLSIQKKHGFEGSVQKEKNSALLQTAQTLENLDQDELFNITFGNGFNKRNSPNKSIVLNQNLPYQKMKKTFSLELEANDVKLNTRKGDGKRKLSRRLIQAQKCGAISQRKIIISTGDQPYRPSLNRQTQNPFQKIKLDIDQILKKKTLVLPKMKYLMPQNGKKQRLSKLVKLFF